MSIQIPNIKQVRAAERDATIITTMMLYIPSDLLMNLYTRTQAECIRRKLVAPPLIVGSKVYVGSNRREHARV